MANHAEILRQVWPEWETERMIGRGAYGYVYQAKHEEHGIASRAAIKIIPVPQDPGEKESLLSEGMTEEEIHAYYRNVVNDFISEIRMLVTLKGAPHIVAIEDFKVAEQKSDLQWDVFIRMELLTPFIDTVRERLLSEEEVIRLGIELSTALEICQKTGIIHRDIKPQNIFVDRFGGFKLGDFGIARKMETMTGSMSQKGTYGYIAPEVSHSTRYDARVDIYSLGLVMYQQVNGGRLPFLANQEEARNPNLRSEALRKRLSGIPLPPPCACSAELARIILKACQYNPDDRYRTPSEMKADLQNLLLGGHVPVSAAPAFSAGEPVTENLSAEDAVTGSQLTFSGISADRTGTGVPDSSVTGNPPVQEEQGAPAAAEDEETVAGYKYLSRTETERGDSAEAVGPFPDAVDTDEKTVGIRAYGRNGGEVRHSGAGIVPAGTQEKPNDAGKKARKGLVVLAALLVVLLAAGGIALKLSDSAGRNGGNEPVVSSAASSVGEAADAAVLSDSAAEADANLAGSPEDSAAEADAEPAGSSENSAAEVIPAAVMVRTACPAGEGRVAPGILSTTAGKEVTVHAVPNAGYRFVKWIADGVSLSGTDEKAADLTVTLGDRDASFTAVFEPVSCKISLTTDGHGSVSPSSASGSFGQTLEIKASPVAGYRFKVWQVVSGDGKISGDATLSDSKLTVGQKDTEIKAVFEPIVRKINIKSSDKSMGTVTANPPSGTIGTNVEIKATPLPGYEFSHWEGDVSTEMSGRTNVNLIVGTKDLNITGVFRKSGLKYGYPAGYPASGQSGSLIVGTVIGNETGWDGTEASGAASAFDGDRFTFFDPLNVGDGYCGIKTDVPYVLEKAAILSRDGWGERFNGAMIQGSNDGINWTTLWKSQNAAASTEKYTVVTSFDNNTGYSCYRYYNDFEHGDVAEVEFYGRPGSEPSKYNRGTLPEGYPSSGESGSLITGKVIGNKTGWGGTEADGAAAAFDGDPVTYFDPLNVGDGYCGIETDVPHTLEKVVIHPRYGWHERYDGGMIQGSNDGVNWTTLYTVSNTLKNYALGAGVTTSSTEPGTKYYGENAVDGRSSTRWSSGYSGQENIIIDLGQIVSIGSIVLKWETAYAAEYEIYTSTDAGNYFANLFGTESLSSAETVTLATDVNLPARYITIHCTKTCGTCGNFSLWEIEVYGQSRYYSINSFNNNSGYTMFRYYNEKNHGDVAEVEFYGRPVGYGSAKEAAAGQTVITGYTFQPAVNGAMEWYEGEGPENLFDGDTGTKLCTSTFPIESTAKLDGTYTVTGFALASANDNSGYPGRNPDNWAVYVSSDGKNWSVLATGDDSFFADIDFTYFAGKASAANVSYVRFVAKGAPSGTFQLSELVLFGKKQ